MKKTLLTIFLLSPLVLLAGDDRGMDMSPLLFIILLIYGINTKRFLRNIPIPYTVILLIIGILLGTADRFGGLTLFPLCIMLLIGLDTSTIKLYYLFSYPLNF